MKIIIGLGNPGPRYEGTRHNVGFEAIDRLAETLEIRVRERKGRSLVGVGKISSEPTVIAKPQTYMNKSGEAASALLTLYQQDPSHLIVIHDDLDLDLGRIRIRMKGRHGGHRGIESIIDSLGTTAFMRLKIGIGRPAGEATDYVLDAFTDDEAVTVQTAMEKVVDAVKMLSLSKAEQAMNQFN